MPGKLPPGWKQKPFVIVNDHDWLYIGTRFVSEHSSDVARTMLFATSEVAEPIANHLRLDAVSGNIRVRPACWMAMTRAKNPIIGTWPAAPAPPPLKRAHTQRREAIMADMEAERA